MTLSLAFPTFNWYRHDRENCPSLAEFCDHCTVCGGVIERYSLEGLAFCDAHCESTMKEKNDE